MVSIKACVLKALSFLLAADKMPKKNQLSSPSPSPPVPSPGRVPQTWVQPRPGTMNDVGSAGLEEMLRLQSGRGGRNGCIYAGGKQSESLSEIGKQPFLDSDSYQA